MISLFMFLVVGVPSLFAWAIIKQVYNAHKRGFDAFRHIELIKEAVLKPEKFGERNV